MADLKVLLVDDEEDFLEPTAARLASRSVACVTAQNGEGALRILNKEHFDCAVVDVRMPVMDGLELLRKTRSAFPTLPVVLLTGHASVELGIRGMELGAFEYLMKPVELDEPQSLWEAHAASIFFRLPAHKLLGRLHRKVYLSLVNWVGGETAEQRLFRLASIFCFAAVKPAASDSSV